MIMMEVRRKPEGFGTNLGSDLSRLFSSSLQPEPIPYQIIFMSPTRANLISDYSHVFNIIHTFGDMRFKILFQKLIQTAGKLLGLINPKIQ